MRFNRLKQNTARSRGRPGARVTPRAILESRMEPVLGKLRYRPQASSRAFDSRTSLVG
jgi:hypothetical protein